MNEGSERFVDEAEKPIPPRSTWGDLSVNELLEVKAELEDKLWAFSNNQALAKVLKQAVADITSLISSQTASR